MTNFPAQSSVLDQQALLNQILPEYDLPELTNCRFLDRGAADIYRVHTVTDAYYLKIYRPPQSLAQTEAEAQLVQTLIAAGLPIVPARPRKTGVFAAQATASEGLRPMLLFAEAPPPLPQELSPKLLQQIGRLTARLHQTLDGLPAQVDIPRLEPARFLNEKRSAIAPFLDPVEQVELGEMIDRLGSWLDQQQPQADFGMCHADLVMSNVRLSSERGVTPMDFGNVMHTFRGLELAVVNWALESRGPALQSQLWDAFLSGYTAVRTLPDLLLGNLPAMLALRQISFLGSNCAHLPLRLGTHPFEQGFLQRELSRLRTYFAQIMF